MSLNPTGRFSDRVDTYAKYRPSYPPEVIGFMKSAMGLLASSVIVDLGSGTGISAELFLKNGNIVYGVEPNDKMREAGEQTLRSYPNFRSCRGTSESTGLPDQTADFIVAAQAFHWFDPKPTRAECQRILKLGGHIALIWNDRRRTGTRFSEEYEALIEKFGIDYHKVKHSAVDHERIRGFLGDYHQQAFYNFQEFDFIGSLGRLASSSYLPNEGHARYEPMKAELKQLFEKHKVNDVVKIEYDTKIYWI